VPEGDDHPGEGSIENDWYIDAIDEVERSAQELHQALEFTVDALRPARDERLTGVELPEIVAGLVARGGKTRREAASVAFLAFQRAVTTYRAVAIRGLVDEHHMTFSEVANLTGVSRQMISRLYKAASQAAEGQEADADPLT